MGIPLPIMRGSAGNGRPGAGSGERGAAVHGGGASVTRETGVAQEEKEAQERKNQEETEEGKKGREGDIWRRIVKKGTKMMAPSRSGASNTMNARNGHLTLASSATQKTTKLVYRRTQMKCTCSGARQIFSLKEHEYVGNGKRCKNSMLNRSHIVSMSDISILSTTRIGSEGYSPRKMRRKRSMSSAIMAEADDGTYGSEATTTLESSPNDVDPETESGTSETETTKEIKTEVPSGYLPILSETELPKGSRVTAALPDGSNQEVLLLWYRGSIYCIENRSPAEGAYSEGLYNARFTQNFGIVCPTTESIFSLKTGEVLEWFPNNPVLAILTPASTARPIEIFPVMVIENVVYVNAGEGSLRQKGIEYNVKTMKGGFGTSLEDNNVFGVEPVMYLEGTEPGTPVQDGEESSGFAGGLNPAVVISSTLAVAIVAVAGTATALYYESLPALAALWLTLFGGVAYIVYNYLKNVGDI